MTNTRTSQPAKRGVLQRMALAFEAMEKTESDYLWDEIVRLRTRQDELEKQLQATEA